MSTKKVCYCSAYRFPHRSGGGACPGDKTTISERLLCAACGRPTAIGGFFPPSKGRHPCSSCCGAEIVRNAFGLPKYLFLDYCKERVK